MRDVGARIRQMERRRSHLLKVINTLDAGGRDAERELKEVDELIEAMRMERKLQIAKKKKETLPMEEVMLVLDPKAKKGELFKAEEGKKDE